MAEIKNKSNIGQIQIADEVIATIAGTAALEVDGVASMAGNITDIAEFLGKKNLSKGVKVNVTGDEASFEISLLIKNGYKIQDVCEEVQKRIKIAIETMTGLKATTINVNVSGLSMEKEKSKKELLNRDE
ncbi:MAG: Asp23/Gls24 family envelope stress response protein [Defluviitaleaceae bacterium]|nr:Asp23/Gls24 family envelope stress response protein [Defluviitaleaceae bacterium]